VDELSSVRVKVTVSRWRIWVSRLWLWAIVASEKTLPGSVDLAFESDRMAAFVCRGVKVEVING
jgi:hypothetical protein